MPDLSVWTTQQSMSRMYPPLTEATKHKQTHYQCKISLSIRKNHINPIYTINTLIITVLPTAPTQTLDKADKAGTTPAHWCQLHTVPVPIIPSNLAV